MGAMLDQLASEVGISASALAQHLQQGGIAETVSPNYLTFDPTTGLVGASFSGGVTIPEQSSASPVTSGSFNFTSAAGIVEFLVGFLSGGQHIALMGSTPDIAGSVFANLKCSSKPGAGPTQTNVQATASDLAGSGSVRIIDAGGLSSFLQLLSAQNLKLQFARTSGVALTSGADTNIPLTSAWPNTHLAFYATVLDAASGSDIVDNSNGRIFLDPGYGSGNYTITWFSLGN